MRIGVGAGYWGAGPPEGAAELAKAADGAGIDSLWTAEAYGSDALTPLSWWGSHTKNVRLGTNIVQMSARTPTATAMAALTLDHLSGGRVVLGVGVSGPQVVEGWYGQAFAKPLARTREYVKIIRDVIDREKPLTNDGPAYPLPLPGGTGLAKPLKSTVHPLRTDLPILLAAEGPKNIALAAEIADGWLAAFYSPASDNWFAGRLAEGFAVPGARRTRENFEVVTSAYCSIDDDIERAADRLRPIFALYIGGMGAKSANFHADAVRRLGYERECETIQAHYLEGDRKAAIAAVPTELVENLAFIGPIGKIADDLAQWDEGVVDTVIMQGDAASLRTVVAARAMGTIG